MHYLKFSVLWREYLVSAVSGLTNSPKISDLTKTDIFQLYVLQNDETVGRKYPISDFCSVYQPLTH